jgi:hypothetical protein
MAREAHVKRQLAFLLVLGLVAGLIAPTEAAAKKKKRKPVPVDVVLRIIGNGDGCALSTATTAPSPDDYCGDPFAGAPQPVLGTGPFEMPALDGMPLQLDASKPIKASITTSSYIVADQVPVLMGVGQPQIHALLSGTSGGDGVLIGEVTTDAYTVTPTQGDYKVEFEIVPPAELQGKVLDGLTLSMEITGKSLFHGVFPADGSSTLTVGAFASK